MAVAVAALLLAVLAPAASAAPHSVVKRLTVGPQTASMVPLSRPSQAGVPRIISGTRAPDGSWPWMASVRQAKSPLSGFCGGSVIARDLVLTAAHCVVADDAKGFKTTTPRPASDFIVVTIRAELFPPSGNSFEAHWGVYKAAVAKGDAEGAANALREIRRLRVERNIQSLDSIAMARLGEGLEHLNEAAVTRPSSPSAMPSSSIPTCPTRTSPSPRPSSRRARSGSSPESRTPSRERACASRRRGAATT